MKTYWIRLSILVLVFLSNTYSVYGQTVVASGSDQNPLSLCVPASWEIPYSAQFIEPINPTNDNRVLFRLIDLDDMSLVAFRNYLNVPVQPGVPFDYIEQTHRFDLPVDGDCGYLVKLPPMDETKGPFPQRY